VLLELIRAFIKGQFVSLKRYFFTHI